MENNTTLEATETEKAAAITTETATAATAQTIATQEAELSDEAFLAFHNKRFGTEYKSLDELKPKAPELTDAEKAKVITAKEKAMLEKHIAKGGSIDDFSALRGIATGDLKEMSLAKTKREFLTAGFTEEQANAQIKSRYYQFEDSEIEAFEEEDRATKIKEKEYFSNKLFNRASPEQKNAKAYLQGLEKEIEDEQYEIEVDNKLAAEAQVIGKTFDKKIVTTLEIKDSITVPPVEDVLSDDDLADIVATIGDKQKREALLYREDGTENLTAIAELLSYKKRYEKAVKAAAYAGMAAATEHIRIKLPDSAAAVYNSPSMNGQKPGTVTSVKVYGGNN
jgi:hypothetical protein